MDRRAPQQQEQKELKPGTITKMTAQRKNAERVSVYLDGAFAFGLYQDLVLEHGLHTGLHLDVARQQQLLAADQAFIARAKAFSFLAYRARSTHEVRQKLQRGGFDEAVIEQVVARMAELGYLDDEAYARSYARGRFETARYGPQRVRSDLMKRGVARDVIERVLADVFEAADEVLDAARAHARKRWPRLAREEDPYRRRKKLSDYLVRRGFSFDVIRRVTDELEAET